MAPMILDSNAAFANDDDDDFVRTISDNDEGIPFIEDEDELISASAPHSSKKRKRSALQEHARGLSGKNKKQRKENKVSLLQIKNRTDSSNDRGNSVDLLEEDQKTWYDGQGEDDGAMDSDFEFQIAGGANVGVVEGFDGWGDEDLGKKSIVHSQNPGDKKGVDIDRLIARRRKVGERDMVSNGNVGQSDDDQDSSGNATGVSKHVLNDDDNDDDEEERPEEVAGGKSNDDEEVSAEQDISDDEVHEEEDETLAEDAFGMGARIDEEDEDTVGMVAAETDSESDSEADAGVADAMPDLRDSEEDGEDAEEIAKRASFFAPEEPATPSSAGATLSSKAFQSMNLSRPILRGLASVGFTNPTPIQTKTIPIALLAKDVVGGAVTGSGKTGAFIIPILERLLHRPKKVPTTRVAILMPTRELAVQCFNVAKKLASFTDITFALLTGGFSLREQESGLRSRPDVIIATPGRFIDHMRNSPSFTVDTLEILVLDEADRMLEDGFADELNEILTTIPRSRQTMLFSATMTDRVDKLIRVGLDKPVRLMVDARKQTVVTLTQEFVRLRPGKEDKRLGYMTYLCSDVYTERVIVFFRQKKEAHRVRIIFGLLGIKAAELHGNMSQEQRISSLTSFRNGLTTHLLATDLASRGLDIPHVSVVLNYEAPQSHEIYLHRVGRTARAGRGGRACTIAADSDRKVVKQAVKAAKAQGAKIVSRTFDAVIADRWAAKVKALDKEVDIILQDEKEEKLLNQTDMAIRKGENVIAHETEIMARPRRTWFESEKEKVQAKKAGREELNGRVGLQKSRHGGGKLSNKDKKSLDDRRERVEGKMWKKGKKHDTKPSTHGRKGKDRGVKGKGSERGKKETKAKRR